MPSYNFIPGLESFMEDTTNVDVSVEVNPAEEAEEAAAAAEDDATIESTAEAAESTAEQSEMILSRFMDLENQYFHIAKYGVDRTYMRLFNQNGELNSALRINLPGCESFDATGSRTSAESIACMEGIGNVLKSIWEFLKKVAIKIGLFFKKIFNAVISRVGKLSSNIERLKEINKSKRNDNVEALKDADEKVMDIEKLKAFEPKLTQFAANADWQLINTYQLKLEQKIKDLTKTGEDPMSSDSSVKSGYKDERSPDDKEKDEKEYDNMKEKCDKFLESVEKEIPDSDGVEVKHIDRNTVTRYLNYASRLIVLLEGRKNALARSETEMKNLERFADTMSHVYKGQAAGHTRRVQLISAYANLESRMNTKCISMLTTTIRRCIHAAGSRLKYAKD